MIWIRTLIFPTTTIKNYWCWQAFPLVFQCTLWGRWASVTRAQPMKSVKFAHTCAKLTAKARRANARYTCTYTARPVIVTQIVTKLVTWLMLALILVSRPLFDSICTEDARISLPGCEHGDCPDLLRAAQGASPQVTMQMTDAQPNDWRLCWLKNTRAVLKRRFVVCRYCAIFRSYFYRLFVQYKIRTTTEFLPFARNTPN